METGGADVGVEEPVSERVTTSTGRFLGPFRQPGGLRLALGTTVKSISDRCPLALYNHVDSNDSNRAIG